MIALGRLKQGMQKNSRPALGSERAAGMPVAAFVEEREFFRIDAEITLQYWPIMFGAGLNEACTLEVNLSGGGMRFPKLTPLSHGQKIWLQISLPGSCSSKICCLGEVVRTVVLDDGQSQVAVRFVNLSPRDQDKIVAFCFAEQRKELRRQVRVSAYSS